MTSNGESGLGEGEEDSLRNRTFRLAAENADQQQHRYDREVLKQQHREAGATGLAAQALLVGQDLHHDRRGGKRSRSAEDDRVLRFEAERAQDCGDRRRGDDDLQSAQSEDQPLHGLQAFERHFQADEEKQEDDAELAQRGDCLGIGDHQRIEGRNDGRQLTQNIGIEKDADQQEAQNGIDAQLQEQRHDEAGGCENDKEFLVVGDALGSHGFRIYCLRIPSPARCGYEPKDVRFAGPGVLLVQRDAVSAQKK